MSKVEIHPRSYAARVMRDSLEQAEWLQTESAARGKELSWDAAVIAGAVASVAMMTEDIRDVSEMIKHVLIQRGDIPETPGYGEDES